MSSFHARAGAGELLARYSFVEPLLPGRRILELGAARASGGESARLLAARGAAEVLSLEPDAAALAEAAAAQAPGVRFQAGDPGGLPEGAFDLVLLADGAPLAAEPERAAALRRLLAPGGRLVTAIDAGGVGLADLAGAPRTAPPPPYQAFVDALSAAFPSVEVATATATVGWAFGLAAEGEPEVAMDGSLAGTPEAAAYVAVCGETPSGLGGLTLVALPAERLVPAGPRARVEATGEDGAEAIRDEPLAAARGRAEAERDEALAARGRAEAERDEAREAAAQCAARIRELEGLLDEARAASALADAGWRRAEADADEARVALADRAVAAAAAAEERARLEAVLAERHAEAEEARAALQAARSEAQAGHAALEAALRRAEEAEARAAQAEEARGRDAAASSEAARLRAELGAEGELRASLEAELEAARRGADAAVARSDGLETDLQSLRWEREELEGRLEAAARAAAAPAAEVARLREEVATRAGENAILSKELERLEAVVRELTDGAAGAASGADAAAPRLAELELRLAEALGRAADLEVAAAAARLPAAPLPGAGEPGEALRRAAQEREVLAAQLAERDAKVARLQREVADKTDRLGRLAKEMGELKARGLGKIFR